MKRVSELKTRFEYAIPVTKVAVSIGALILVALYVDAFAVWKRLSQTSPAPLVVAIILGITQVLVVGLRWTFLARFVNYPNPAPSGRQFQSINYASLFIGQFLPLLAADALRIIYARAAGMLLHKAFISTACDRAVALFLLAVICVIDVLMVPWLSEIPGLQAIFISIALSSIAGISLILMVGGKKRPSVIKLRVLKVGWELLASCRRLCLSFRVLIPVVLLGLTVHGLSITMFWLVCVGQGLDVSIYDAMAVVPLVLFGLAIPISIAGWGLREGLVVALFSQIHISPEAAVAASLAFGTTLLIAALPGAYALLSLPKADPSRSPHSALENAGAEMTPFDSHR